MCGLLARLDQIVEAEFQKRCVDAFHSNSESFRESNTSRHGGQAVRKLDYSTGAATILRCGEIPTNGQSGTEGGPRPNIIVHVPDRCSQISGIEKKIIGLSVAVEIRRSH